MKGDLSKNRFQIPRDERPLSALNISHQLVTLQLFLSSTDDFAVEFNISQSTVAAIKLVIGTHIKETSVDTLHDKRVYRLPLIIPRGKWVQVIFHLSGIMRYLFNLPPMRSIDGFAFMGSGKILKMSCGSSEQACIDSTPKGMALFAVPAYAPPVWTSAAAKTEEEPIKARGGGGGMQVVGMNARNAPSSPSRGEKKLPPIAGGKPPQISEERPRSSITETPAAYQRRETPPSPAGFKREYIRFIDTPQAQPPSSRPPARRQETGRGKEPPQTAQVNDVSAWGDNIISAKKRKFSVFFFGPERETPG
ncbi:hypothetical protein AGDE_15776 [Angomonas deanei]|uniref:CFA20 domain-containing protein n=1 Tax=Angomonas deanei TaxID=59799 RepID=A0A7G2CUD3_9TRYP|nr:hypothetical protein AGDE_15776 [Angomonas deanei]CAD2221852.1 Protein of unknown function (DUF667), putative [Angomonas deanei]|eukprot:EPY18461.1 hypothetical protein AGDE_15776 [Angomonas deanei]